MLAVLSDVMFECCAYLTHLCTNSVIAFEFCIRLDGGLGLSVKLSGESVPTCFTQGLENHSKLERHHTTTTLEHEWQHRSGFRSSPSQFRVCQSHAAAGHCRPLSSRFISAKLPGTRARDSADAAL
eukprot:768669-Hanusia_phi.AAC.3